MKNKNVMCVLILLIGSVAFGVDEENIAGFRNYFAKAGSGYPVNYNLSFGVMDLSKSRNVGWGVSIECWGVEGIAGKIDTLPVWPDIGGILPNFCVSGYGYVSPYSNIRNIRGEEYNLRGDLMPLIYFYGGGSPANCIQLNCTADSMKFVYAPFFDIGMGVAFIFSRVTADTRIGIKMGQIGDNSYFPSTRFRAFYFSFNIGMGVGCEITENRPNLIPKTKYY